MVFESPAIALYLTDKFSKNGLGPLPAEVQVPTILSVGIGTSAGNVKAAKALIQFLQGPVIAPALKANGIER